MGKFAKFKIPKVHVQKISPFAVSSEVLYKFGDPTLFEKMNETKAANAALVKLLNHLVLGSQLTKDSALTIMKNIRLKHDAVEYSLRKTKFECNLSNGLIKLQTDYRGRIEKLETSPSLQQFPRHVQKEFITSAVANCMLQSKQRTREYKHQIKEEAMQELYDELEKYDQSDALLLGKESSQLNGLQIDYATAYLDARMGRDYKGDLPPDITDSFEMMTLFDIEDAVEETMEDDDDEDGLKKHGRRRSEDQDDESEGKFVRGGADIDMLREAEMLSRNEASEHYNEFVPSKRFNMHTLRSYNIDSSFDDLIESGDYVEYKVDSVDFDDVEQALNEETNREK